MEPEEESLNPTVAAMNSTFRGRGIRAVAAEVLTAELTDGAADPSLWAQRPLRDVN